MFRKESVRAKQISLPGKVTLTQPFSVYFICSLVFTIFILLLIFSLNTRYSRKETVKGYLLPEQGVVKVFSGRSGILEELLVSEGDDVKEGQVLAKIRNSQNLISGIELSAALQAELSSQITSLNEELKFSDIVFDKSKLSIDRKMRELDHSLSAIQKAMVTSKLRLKLKEEQYDNNLALYKKGYLSMAALSSIQEDYLEAQGSVNKLETEMASISVDIANLESQRISLPEERALKRTSIQRQLSVLKADIVRLNNEYEFIKNAPESGIVTAIQPSIGSQVDSDSPILSIIPKNSPLILELFLPSRSAGFIQVGDQVKIRFDAFPYQKFGLVDGKISNIDKALILPSDKKLPINITEAMYRVRASINQQEIHAYGKSFPLKVGMIAEADIVLDNRSLLEWLLDPIYAIKGKI
ncbi:HlyD family secretion protein [Vibrio diazotrophicus]|nr:HlyD family secretion protein [Vibrio diazotrophicus]